MKRLLKIVVLLAVLVFVVAQLFRPERTNPREDPTQTLDAVLAPPADVARILDRACADCHSNRTRWPWYSSVAPTSWFVADHVRDGRAKMSFSYWAAYPQDRQARKLRGICNVVKKDEMPLASYLFIHRDAKLSDADKKTLCDWTDATRAKLGAPPTTP
jgi:hypothetical protein